MSSRRSRVADRARGRSEASIPEGGAALSAYPPDVTAVMDSPMVIAGEEIGFRLITGTGGAGLPVPSEIS